VEGLIGDDQGLSLPGLLVTFGRVGIDHDDRPSQGAG
jgi:hypothetical protein